MTIKPIKTKRDRQKGLKDIKNSGMRNRVRRFGYVGGGLRTEALPHRATDLAKILGGRNRASEVLNKKRNLVVEMKRALHRADHRQVGEVKQRIEIHSCQPCGFTVSAHRGQS